MELTIKELNAIYIALNDFIVFGEKYEIDRTEEKNISEKILDEIVRLKVMKMKETE